jgi:hypothetical protein
MLGAMRTRSARALPLLGLLACAPAAPPAARTRPPEAAPVAALPPAPSSPGQHSLQLGASQLRIQLDGERFDLGAAPLLEWIARCARAVEAYYGGFPVPEALLVVHSARGRGVHGGHAQPGEPPRIDIRVGVQATTRELDRNWSLTHELVHLAFPNLARRHHWLEEGLASYVEPIARARAHWLEEADVWREWLGSLEQGLPQAGDRGLDHTPTWGRTYWGGALFCFVADLRLRRESGGRHELRDALRAIVAAGGNINQRWPIERALRVGDEATHSQVLTRLYGEMKDAPVHVDLDATWLALGVSQQGGEIRYDDSAQLAEIRKVFVLGR